MNPNILRQARKLQEQLAKIQADLEKEMVVGSAGAGAVEVTLDGHGKLQRIHIAPQAIDPSDPETLEALITVAFNDAQAKVAELSSSRMGPLAGGLGLPGF
jgi:DNA-binding YbaB/EbfC family protein